MKHQKKFGTAPVFFTAISTILGAVMFLRFGFAVGNVGLLGAVAIILLGHLVTIPTAMAIAEIATNQKVEGGGEYFIISRSFGLVIGASIGIALFASQAISVAFYIIAFSEAFTPLVNFLTTNFQVPEFIAWLIGLKQTISIPALLILTVIVLTKGADLGVKTLYGVVFVLFLSLTAFFVGSTEYSRNVPLDVTKNISNYDPSDDLVYMPDNSVRMDLPRESEDGRPLPWSLFAVFAIIFPAFTGMTAGVGLSGDLENPGRSIPIGTLGATIGGMVIYILIAWKLSVGASPADLVDTKQLVMAKIAWQGWLLIPIGLAAATVSSALGSILVAPRTLQAIARDKILPSTKINSWLAHGRGTKDEPYNATMVVVAIAFVFVLIGGLDFVAEIISMFFMMTYGALNLISFLQHFAADPSYRPTFKSRWYISLLGALACFFLMFAINPTYAFLAIIFMIGFYFVINYYNSDKSNVAHIFQGVIFQISRRLQVFLQSAEKEKSKSWRPSTVCISENSFERLAVFDLMRWISQKYGFGTYIHYIPGYLSKKTNREAQEAKERLIKMSDSRKSNVYIDTMISPSYTSAIAQVIQLPGISGSENNLLLLEYSKDKKKHIHQITDNFKLIKSVQFDLIVLASSARGFGLNNQIHIWITQNDYNNANLMILLAYIIIGHREWTDGQIKIFAVYPESVLEEERNKLLHLIEEGKLPISVVNISFISAREAGDIRSIITTKSKDADLTMIGLREEAIKHNGIEEFEGYDGIGNILFVNASESKQIK